MSTGLALRSPLCKGPRGRTMSRPAWSRLRDPGKKAVYPRKSPHSPHLSASLSISARGCPSLGPCRQLARARQLLNILPGIPAALYRYVFPRIPQLRPQSGPLAIKSCLVSLPRQVFYLSDLGHCCNSSEHQAQSSSPCCPFLLPVRLRCLRLRPRLVLPIHRAATPPTPSSTLARLVLTWALFRTMERMSP